MQEIYPQLPALRDATLRLNQEYPIVAVGVRSLPTFVSPDLAVLDSERQSLDLVFESLVRLAGRPSMGERYVSALSSDLPQVAPLGRVFQLPRDVCFDNGQPLRAGDVSSTIGLMSNAAWAGHDVEWAKLMAKSPHIEDDAFQIKLTMQHGYLDPLALMDFKVLPESLDKMDRKKFASNPVGSGPFHFRGTEGGKAFFTASEYYGERQNREGLPKIREIHLVKSTDPARDFHDLNFGMLLDPTTAKFKELQGAGIDNLVSFKTLPNRRIYFLALNQHTSVFQNETFRRGLAHAIKREEILDQCFRADLKPKPHRALNGPYPAGSWACNPGVRSFSPIFAKAELDAAKASRAAKTTLTLKYPDEDPAVAAACKLIKEQIEALDNTLTIELLARSPEQMHQEVEINHDYQMAYYSHDYPTEAFWLWPFFQVDGARKNFLGYENDGELEGLLRKQMGHRNITEVQRLAHQIHQHFFDKMPFVPLWQLDTHLVIRNNLRLPSMLDPLAVFRDADSWVLEKQ